MKSIQQVNNASKLMWKRYYVTPVTSNGSSYGIFHILQWSILMISRSLEKLLIRNVLQIKHLKLRNQ